MSGWTHDICFGQPTKDPQKKRWINCGSIFTNDKGQISIKLDVLPLGIDPVKGLWLSVFEKKDKPQQGQGLLQDNDQVPF